MSHEKKEDTDMVKQDLPESIKIELEPELNE